MVLAAAIVHFGLSIVLALVLAMLIAAFRLDSGQGPVALSGALFGVGAYLLNFYVFTRYFNWFDRARGLRACWRMRCSGWLPPRRTGTSSAESH